MYFQRFSMTGTKIGKRNENENENDEILKLGKGSGLSAFLISGKSFYQSFKERFKYKPIIF